MSVTSRRVVWVLGTGGTIAGESRNGSRIDYESGRIDVNVLLPDLANSEHARHIRVEGLQIASLPSQAMVPADWQRIGSHVGDRLGQADTAGVVVLTGTDVMEELAYYLHLTLPSEKPVVVTGSMRPHGVPGSDGQANLHDAITIALSRHASRRGVLVTMNGYAIGARNAVKTHTRDLSSMRPRESGVEAWVAGDIARFAIPRRHTFLSEFSDANTRSLPKVEILYGYAGDNSHLVASSIAHGAEGIVFCGVGHGNLNPQVEAALKGAVQRGVAVLRASCCAYGPVWRDAEVHDTRAGFLTAYDLPPAKARVLLMLGLQKRLSRSLLQALFEQY